MPPARPRTRVLLLSSVFPNAAQPVHGVFVRERMRGLPEELEVRVVAPTPWFPLVSRLVSGLRPGFRPQVPRREEQDGIEVLHPRFLSVPAVAKCLDGILMFLSLLPVLLRLRKRFPFQVIDAHFTYPEGLAAVLLGKVFRVPVVITERGTLPLLARFALRRPQLRFALRHATRLIAVSGSLRQDAIALGQPPERVRVIENGIDPAGFRPLDRGEARRRLGLPESGPLLVSVGTLAPRKGFHLVLEAMSHLRGRFPGLRFAMVGGAGPEGAMEQELRALAERLDLTGQALFAGARTRAELPLWYSAADVFVLASSHEGCPNVVLEALACGTPVVATPVGNIPEILDRPDLGLITQRDVPSLTAALAAALSRSWDRDALSARVHTRTWEAVGREAADELLLAVVGGGGAAGPAQATGRAGGGERAAHPKEPSKDRRPRRVGGNVGDIADIADIEVAP